MTSEIQSEDNLVMAESEHPSPRFLSRIGIDLPAGARQPGLVRFIIAIVVAIGVSLLACAALVAIGIRVFPSTVGYAHFQFADYGKLTVIGVFLACLAWPVTTWFASRARVLFLWLTILVTIVGLAPDAWILYKGKGQPLEAVGVLVAMHFALAVITYCSLVFIAPQRTRRS